MELRKYLDLNSINAREFAKRIDIPYTSLMHALNGTRGLPKKYWKKIILVTNRKVTLDDLYEMHRKFKASQSRSS